MNTLGTTHPYFIIEVTAEQQAYAKSLVEYSIANHPVKDIFADDPDGKRRQFEFRYTGTLGEVVFADAYRLQRPSVRSAPSTVRISARTSFLISMELPYLLT